VPPGATPGIVLHSYTSRRGNVAGADGSRNRIYGVCGDDHVTVNHVSVPESDGGMVGININDFARGLQLSGTAGTWRASTSTRRPSWRPAQCTRRLSEVMAVSVAGHQ
jgi:hypothetical protein